MATSGPAGASIGKITVPTSSVIPQGVGAPPPPGLDPKKGKLMCIKVRMLDDTVGVFHLGHKALGQALFDEVCRHLNLLECDYFGLEFLDCFANRCWLDKEKSILKQITLARSDARFYFFLKFYTPTPADLEEEYTRYLVALQIKRDLASGQFVCNENTAALMASYIVQSECGDFSPFDYHDHSYLSSVRFVPNQSEEFEKKVMENHKRLIGMSPAESDLALLETARRSEFYGVKFHPARDIEGTTVALAVLHLGIRVYHHLTCVNTFSWAKLRKLSFKRKKLFIKLLPESCTYYKDMIEFSFETRNECKMFWKKCVEHHAFFRCSEITPASRQQSRFFTKGSSFRYSGRTQQQLIDYVREHHKRREPFTRPLLSSKTKKIHGERLLPTPISSLPGTLDRENGGIPSGIDPVTVFRESVNYGEAPTHTVDDRENTTNQTETDSDVYNETVRGYQTDTECQETDEYNNGDSHVPPTAPYIIPPTPDTPQLRRKAPKNATTPSTIRQQITFHFPVSELCPDSPSSSSEVSRGKEEPKAGIQAPLDDQSYQIHEWAAPPSPQLPPLSPGMEGDGAEEDNVSEDSYHLAEHEENAHRIRQRASNPDESYISASLPASALRPGVAMSLDQEQQLIQEPKTKSAASLDLVFPSNSSHDSQQRRNVQTVEEAGSPPRSRGLSRPLPGRVVPKGQIIVARTKPIPPPKPKMGLVHLERSARGDYNVGPAQQVPVTFTQPVIVSQSTVTTMEVTTRRENDPYTRLDEQHTKMRDQVDRTGSRKNAENEENTGSRTGQKKDWTGQGQKKDWPGQGQKKVAFVLPGTSEMNESIPGTIVGDHSPTPPGITSTTYPPDLDPVITPQSVPTIEVESEEYPNIKHKIVNGDIPYILHVRHVKKRQDEVPPSTSSSGSHTFSTFKDPPAVKTVPEQVTAEIALVSAREQSSWKDSSTSNRRSSSAVGRRKSFDLVQRKRLPSPASFSSQDHSVSPDSEHDVAGFVSKFRGTKLKDDHHEKGSLSRRTDPRRMTQPIQPHPIAVKPKPAFSQPCIPVAGEGGEDSDDEVISLETPSLHEGMDLLEQLDDTERVSLDVGGDMTESLHRTLGMASGLGHELGPGEAPFIDDRASSESIQSTVYDNLSAGKKDKSRSLSSTTGGSPGTT